jgi:DNA-directed RNA polymerase subunit H (RpoH/RPB5)
MSIEIASITLTKMLSNRGFFEKEKDIFQNDKEELLKIFYCIHMKVNIEIVKNYLQNLEELGIYHCIIVYNQMITSSTKKIFENMIQFEFEIFHLDELQYDLTEHILYYPHIKLKNEEKQQISKNIIKHLPIILQTDPVSRYFHFKKGDIIKIIRKGSIIVYRIVK